MTEASLVLPEGGSILPTLIAETKAAFERSTAAIASVGLKLRQLSMDMRASAASLKSINDHLKAVTEAPDGVLITEQIQELVERLGGLLNTVESFLDAAHQANLANVTLTATPLAGIAKQAEALEDHIDTLELSIDPEVEAAIDEGRRQVEAGDFEVLERIG